MKTKHRFEIVRNCVIASGLFFLLFSCAKMDDTYKGFVVPDGLVYVGKADPVSINSGKQRIKVSWLRGTDQKATMARIYWNNRADSLNVPITATRPKDTISVIINNLNEGSYVFQIFTYDNAKNSSIQVDALGVSYGMVYEKSLLNRVITDIKKGSDTAILTLLSVDATSLGTKFSYTNKNGARVDTLVDQKAQTLRLPNMNKDTAFTYVTMYKPVINCLDTFYAPSGKYPR